MHPGGAAEHLCGPPSPDPGFATLPCLMTAMLLVVCHPMAKPMEQTGVRMDGALRDTAAPLDFRLQRRTRRLKDSSPNVCQ